MAGGRLIWPVTVVIVAAILAAGGVLTARALATHPAPSTHAAAAASSSQPASAAASSQLASGLQTYLASCAGAGLVKPRDYTLACADGGIWLSGLTWLSWTSTGALGSGTFGQNNCVPDCAQGKPVYFSAQVRLSDGVTGSGGLRFFGSLIVVTSAWTRIYDVTPVATPFPVTSGATVLTGKWTSSQLTITPDSLGAVRVGMTIAQGSTAAGEPLVIAGDGFYYAGSMGSDSGLEAFAFNGPIACVFASQASRSPSVVTAQGFHLGGSFADLQQTYGTSLEYVPAPATAISPRPGYIVRFPNGNVVFWVTKGIVISIGAGPGAMPTTCGSNGLV
jgi:hypothetical protein